MSQDSAVVQVPVDDLVVLEDRATATYDEHELAALRSSIEEEGIREPLAVVRVGGKLVITDGFNRFRIALDLGHKTVPCKIREGNERDAMLENLVRNLQRGKNKPADMARVALQLRDKHSLPIEEIAAKTGLSRGWVEQLLQLEHLQPWVRDLLDAGSLKLGVAMELARLQDGDVQIRAANHALTSGLTVAKAREFVSLVLEELAKPKEEQRPIEDVRPPPAVCQLCGPVTEGVPMMAPICCAPCWGAVVQANHDAAVQLQGAQP